MRRAALLFLLCALALTACGAPLAEEQPAPAPVSSSAAPAGESEPVLNVHDGDTFTIPEGPVRVLGINTPEISNPPECYGQEATAAARDLLADSMVLLVPDPQQGDKDRYNRLLRYVTTDQGEDLAAWLLRYGYAKVYEEYPVARTPEYLKIQEQARAEMRGGWQECKW